MAKRVLSMTPSELTRLTREDFLSAVAGSEGRVLACETIGIVQPMLADVTNAEFCGLPGGRTLSSSICSTYKSPWCRLCPRCPRRRRSGR